MPEYFPDHAKPPEEVTMKGHYHVACIFLLHIQTIRKKLTLYLCMKWPQVCVPAWQLLATLWLILSHAACLGHPPAQIFVLSLGHLEAAASVPGQVFRHIWLADGVSGTLLGPAQPQSVELGEALGLLMGASSGLTSLSWLT